MEVNSLLNKDYIVLAIVFGFVCFSGREVVLLYSASTIVTTLLIKAFHVYGKRRVK